MVKALRINNCDNCAVLLADVKREEAVEVQTLAGTILLSARQDIAMGHKIALVSLDVDQPIVKYGEEIGRAGATIEAGGWIHVHNTVCRRGHENQE